MIEEHRPDALLPTLGGQTGLNLAVGARRRRGARPLRGARCSARPLDAVRAAEDRGGFRSLVTGIGEPVPESAVVESVEDGLRFVEMLNAPVVVRPAFTLGGGGGGFATTLEEARDAHRRRARREPDRPGPRRAQPAGLVRDRVRGPARRLGHDDRHLRDGEPRPDGRPHRRLDRRRADPDPARPRRPAPAPLRAEDRPRAEARGRLQRPARRGTGRKRLPGHRGQPARLALVGAGLEGDRLPDRADRGARSRSGDGCTSCRTRPPAATAPPSSRPSTTSSSSCRAGRSTSSRPPTGRSASR